MVTSNQFFDMAATANGVPYVFGANAKRGSVRPRALDCSELILWAAGRLGVKVVDGAINQYRMIAKRGLTMPVSQALRTRGAILFKRGRGKHAPIYHVGISVGDGKHTFEAKGKKYGTGFFEVGKWSDSPNDLNRYNLAGMLPGVDYSARKKSPAMLPIVVGLLAGSAM